MSPEQFARLWTTAQSAVISYLTSVVPNFRDTQDILHLSPFRP